MQLLKAACTILQGVGSVNEILVMLSTFAGISCYLENFQYQSAVQALQGTEGK